MKKEIIEVSEIIDDIIDNRTDKEKLQAELNVFNIIKINQFIDLKQYFDIANLDEDSTPAIMTDKKTFIIFDNQSFNETYLLVLVNDLITKLNFESISMTLQDEIKFVYVDDFLIRTQLFTDQIEYYQNQSKLSESDNKSFEKEKLTPCFITINPEKDEICIFKEFILSTFTLDSIEKIINDNLLN
jgi:hypothetical protein